MKFLYGFTIDVVDPDHDDSPAYLRIRGDWAGSLKKRYYTDDELMEKMYEVYEIGVKHGRRYKAEEIKKSLGL